jgi:DNA-directed RNA polymerase subunit RPC12/RpoP|tara:strand:- start:272 stop:511 length:240 start_codon:yes stop_codon:yes gene_type:complete
MSTKPMKPLPQQKVQVDLTEAETMNCEQCNNKIFIQGYVIKKISAIMSPTGQEVIAPVQVFNCGNCGEILPLADVNELI